MPVSDCYLANVLGLTTRREHTHFANLSGFILSSVATRLAGGRALGIASQTLA